LQVFGLKFNEGLIGLIRL